MATTYDIGDKVRESATFLTVAGATADPTKVYFSVENPSGVVTHDTYASSGGNITRTATGDYYRDIVCTGRGVYEYRWHSTGAVFTAQEGWFSVRPRRVT
jgi:hypothetical protein